jgi:recombination protein RecA
MGKKRKAREGTAGKSIDDVFKQIQKKFGAESVHIFGDKVKTDEKIEVISTGSILVDQALGLGGFPRGRIIEILGPESSGKTTVALHVIAEAQKRGGMAAFIDAEHALDLNLAKKMGVDLKKLMINQPDTGEQGLEIVEMAAESGKFAVIVIDSVSALTPRAEIEGDMGDSHMGLQARMMGQALRKIVGVNAKTNTMTIFINQIRHKIGVSWGSNETTSGGNALKFFASIRLDIRRTGSIVTKVDGEERVIGNKVKVKIIKNKLAMPFKVIETELLFGKGFNMAGELIQLGEASGVVEQEGKTFLYKHKPFAKGKNSAYKILAEDKKLFEAIRADIVVARSAKHAKDTEEV